MWLQYPKEGTNDQIDGQYKFVSLEEELLFHSWRNDQRNVLVPFEVFLYGDSNKAEKMFVL